MTSNIGAEDIKRQSAFGFALPRDESAQESQAYEEMRKKLLDSLKKIFRPEFLNRLDGVVVFRALNKEDIRQIVTLELSKVSDRLKDHNIVLHASDAAVDQLADEGYDPDMGARPLRRVIQHKIEDYMSDALLSHEFKDGDTILVDLNEDREITLRREEELPAPEEAVKA
jgi:ATP-dependent Clp protease ATP-binding subunit ClpC